MPIECTLLKDAAVPLDHCPSCGAAPFDPFLRGMVQRGPFSQLWAYLQGKPDWRRYCALICWECKEIVGYE